MGMTDEPSSRGLLERVTHRQANRAYEASRGDIDRNYNRADLYANPPAPIDWPGPSRQEAAPRNNLNGHSAGSNQAKRPRYSNAQPG